MLRFGVAAIHPEYLGREETGFVAAGAGANFEHDIFIVERVFRQEEHFDVFLHLRDGGSEPFDLERRQLLHVGIGLVEHGSGLRELVRRLPIVTVFGDDFGKIAVRFRDFGDTVRRR